MVKKSLFFLLLFCLACSKGYISVQPEIVDINYLASYHAKTPDRKLEDPPQGKNIHISWDFPKSLYDKELTLHFHIRLKNDEEKIYTFPIKEKRGTKTFFFPYPKEGQKKILSYAVKAYSKNNELVAEWKHHFWAPVIKLEEN